MILFNIPPFVGTENEYIKQAIEAHKICGDGEFTKKCNAWLENRFNAQKVLLTTSGTTALDMAALLCNIQPGDEVILPSYTFSSTANSVSITCANILRITPSGDLIVKLTFGPNSSLPLHSNAFSICTPVGL